MLRIRGSVDEGRKIAHALNLVVQAIQRPDVDGIVALVKDLACDSRLCGGSKNRIGHITDVVQACNGVDRRCRGCERTTRCNHEVV